MRLGLVELAVLGLVGEANGYLDYSVLKSMLRGECYLSNLCRACRSLASKNLVRLHCRGSGRIEALEINSCGVIPELIRRTFIGRNI